MPKVELYDLSFSAKIGENDLGALYSGTWQDKPVTIKWVEGIPAADHKNFVDEVQAMSALNSESIIPFYGASFDENRLYFLTEPMESGDLYSALPTLEPQERLLMAQDLAKGLSYLHASGKVHGDIKPSNIGVNQDHRGKWMNIGLVHTRATSLASRNVTQKEVCWQAPEAWKRSFVPSEESDVYGFGCLLWSLMAGRICEGKTEKEAMLFELSEECTNLILACWAESPRPKAHEIVQRLQDMAERVSSFDGEVCYERGNNACKAGKLD